MTSTRSRIGLGVAALLILRAAAAGATTVLVPTDSTLTIQAGIDLAVSGDTVLVAPGVYAGAGNRDLDFGGKNLILLAPAGPDSTVLDGGNAGRGFHFHSGESASARVIGFTVIRGSADHGGAIRCEGGASPTVVGCAFLGNAATGGGGAISAAGGSSPAIAGCTISANTAGGVGGGISVEPTAAIAVTQSILWGNCAGSGEEASVADGASVSFTCSLVDPSGVAGAGSISYLNDVVFESPLFCNPALCGSAPVAQGYTLLDCSPALAGNNACSLRMGSFGQGCVGYTTATVPGDFPTIQEALHAVCPGGTVEVAAGTHAGPGNRNLAFGGKNVTLRAVDGPQVTVIDCEKAGRAFVVAPGDAPVIQGFTVRNGEVPQAGGAAWIVGVSPRFVDCVFQGNAVSLGDLGGGGAIYCLSASPEFESCLFSGNRSARDGGAVFADSGSAPHFLGCTITGNATEEKGGGISVSDSSKVTLEESVLWGNCAAEGDDGYRAERSDTLSFACSNFAFAGIGGLGLTLTPDANVFTDPLFCDPLTCGSLQIGGNYTVDAQSPCLPDNNDCGVLMGARGQGCGLPRSPVVLAVTDVPNDQGRQVRVSWQRSGLDREGSTVTIDTYEIYRLVDSTLAGLASTAALEGWDYLMEVPAHGSQVYSVIAPTLADSTILGGLYLSTFAVRAAAGIPTTFYDSGPATGYSVDNLSPHAPAGVLVKPDPQGSLISWAPSEDADFLRFRVYRGGSQDFVPGPQNLLRETIEPRYVDPVPPDPSRVYKVSALDQSGNESAPALARSGSTPVVLLAFTAQRTEAGAEIAWRVANDPGDLAGFRLHRENAVGERMPLHDGLLSGADRYRFTDPAPPAGEARYWLAESSRDGTLSWHGPAVLPAGVLPVTTRVFAAPNPVRAATTFRLEIAEAGPVVLRIFDAAGREVSRPVASVLDAGLHEAAWDGRDMRGARVPTGVYFYRLETKAMALGGKLVLID